MSFLDACRRGCAVLLGVGLLQAAMAAPVLRSELGALELREIAAGLEHPWALAFLPDGQGMLVTERPGRLRRVGADGQVSAPCDGTLSRARAQGPGYSCGRCSSCEHHSRAL